MNILPKLISLATACAIGAGVQSAAADDDPYRAFILENAASWLSDPTLLATLDDANQAHAGLSEADIVEMDDIWRREVGLPTAPSIDAVTQTAGSAHLRQIVEDSTGRVSEIIVMDRFGLNAAISSITSDYWQGDEEKFQMTYPVGVDAVHVSDVSFDESVQAYVVQVSVVVTDAAGAAVGAATIGLNAEMF